MNLFEHLIDSGVSLDQEVGLLVEVSDDSGVWNAIQAEIGRVCTDIPDDTFQDYDPEYELALTWQISNQQYTCRVSVYEDSETYVFDDTGGLMIDNPGQRIMIGQDQQFMAYVADKQRSLKLLVH
jgi:hypothetical protein